MKSLTENIETLELISIQYEIAQSLNPNLDLRALCRRYMETCIRRLSAKAIHLYMPVKKAAEIFEESEITHSNWGRISMPKRSACFPEHVEEIAAYVEQYVQNYDPSKAEEFFINHFCHGDTHYHCFTMADMAALVIEKDSQQLPEQIINALAPIVKELFFVCQLSLQHLQVVNQVERRLKAEQQLTYIAYHDELTKLPNRISLIKSLDKEIESCRQTEQTGILVYIDLDYFRDINDSLGHVIGDKLLQQVSARLKTVTIKGEILSRLSSDEFVILCPSQYQPHVRIDQLLVDINTCFAPQFNISDRSLKMNASIGVTHYSSASENAYTVLMQSDLAMSKAKKNTGVSIEFYQSDMERDARRRFMLDTDMRKAAANNEYELVIQPQVNHKGMIIGGETLMRWYHPELGTISPVEFIEIAEKTGFIIELGEWIFEQACMYVKQMQCYPVLQHLKLAINLSAKQFYQPNFVNRIKEILNHYQTPSDKIELELTESIMLEDAELTIRKINQLKRLGIEISIDDFGTGYSSLSYLKHLPIDRIKIDRSFVTNIDHRPDNAAIVEAIVMMANRFDLKLIAEGVENESEVKFLKSMGCVEYQGYYFYQPMSFADFLKEFSHQKVVE